MKISKQQLIKIIKEEKSKILKEYEQYVDEDGNIWDDEGNVTRKGAAFGRQYGGDTYGTNAPWQGGRSRSRYSSSRKTTSVSAGANDNKITAIKKALEVKPNKFLTSVLNQLQANRGLSSKQNTIVKRILTKTSPEDAKLFESSKRVIKETVSMTLVENLDRAMEAIAYEMDDPQWAAEFLLDQVNGFIESLNDRHGSGR